MGIKPISRTNVSSKVFDQLKEQIILGEWKPGEKIPSENELAKQLNVSRITVRQALHRLIAFGLIETRVGEGSFVKEISAGVFLNSIIPVIALGQSATMEVLEFRQMVEPETARIAAIKATPDDIEKLRKMHEKMKVYSEKGDISKYVEEDLNFHFAIAHSTKNSLIIHLNNIIKDLLNISMKDIVSSLGTESGIYFHKRILEALEQSDSKKAREVMEEHVTNTMLRMLQIRNNTQ